MAEKAFKVEGKPYAGIDILAIAEEQVFKSAVRGLNAWKDNLGAGEGAKGSRRPWVDTGEARANLSIRPGDEGSLEYEVYGNVIQLYIAEFGRSPNNAPPPKKAIEDWVARKGIATRGSPEFDGIVHAVRMKIAKDGIKGFAPGLKAAHDSTVGLEAELRERLMEEHRARHGAASQGFIG